MICCGIKHVFSICLCFFRLQEVMEAMKQSHGHVMIEFFSLVDSPVMKFNPTNREELKLSLRHVAIRAKHFSVTLSFLENSTVIEAFHKLLFLMIVVSTVAFRHLESVIQQALPHLSRNSLNCPLRTPNFTPAPYI